MFVFVNHDTRTPRLGGHAEATQSRTHTLVRVQSESPSVLLFLGPRRRFAQPCNRDRCISRPLRPIYLKETSEILQSLKYLYTACGHSKCIHTMPFSIAPVPGAAGKRGRRFCRKRCRTEIEQLPQSLSTSTRTK